MPTDRPWLRSALPGIALLSIAAADWQLAHAYRGLFHDAGLYILQGLAHAHPDSVGQDVFLRFGSQDRFSIFGRVLGALLRVIPDPEPLAAALTLCFQLALLAAAAILGRAFLCGRTALLGLIAVLALPLEYGSDRVFTVIEPFLTARMAGEALALAALTAAVLERLRLSAAVLAAALVVHPVMAAAGVVAVFSYSMLIPNPRRSIIFALAALILLGLGVVWLPAAGGRLEGDWLALVAQRSPYLFISSWGMPEWSRAGLTAATLAMGTLRLEDPRARRLCAAVLLTAVAGIVLAALGGDLVHSALVLRLQPWRWEWLAVLVAALMMPALLVEPGRHPTHRSAPLLLATAWLLDPSWGMLGVAALALIVQAALRRLGPDEARLVHIGSWLALAVAFGFSVAAGLEFTEGHYLDNRLPLALRQAMSFVHDGSVPIALALLVAWLARSKPVLPPAAAGARVASTPARDGALALLAVLGVSLVIGLCPATARQWTRRDSEWRAQDFADWRRIVAPSAEVFWPAAPAAAWVLLERPHYLSALQTSGLVFSKSGALELARRAVSLAPVVSPRQFLDWNAAGLSLALSPAQLRAACSLGVFDFLVTSAPIGGAPAAVLPAPSRLALYRCR